MDQGFIYLHRKLLDSRVFKSEGLLKVWIWCLLKASHKGRWVQIKRGKGTSEIWLKPGQFIFGRLSAAKKLKMPPSTFRNRMKKLQTMQNLDIKQDNTYSIASIINWDSYQLYNNKKDSKKDSYRTAIGQLKDTDKNGNNVKNDKEYASVPPLKDVKEFSLPKVEADIQNLADKLYEEKKFTTVHAFVNSMIKKKVNSRAILHALTRVYLKPSDNKDFKPWAYALQIIKVENGNYNEQLFRKVTPKDS